MEEIVIKRAAEAEAILFSIRSLKKSGFADGS